MREQLDALYAGVESRARQLSTRSALSACTSSLLNLLRQFSSSPRGHTCAAQFRIFRETHLRSYFQLKFVSSPNWLPAWSIVESEWANSPERQALTAFYLCWVDEVARGRTCAQEELLAAELAHIAKFLPLTWALDATSTAEAHASRDFGLFDSTVEKSVLFHPEVDSSGRVVAAYAYDSPDWDLPFVDDAIATSRSARRLDQSLFPRLPKRYFCDGGIDLIGHMGHCGSTLLARLIELRRGRRILREPRDLGWILRLPGQNDLEIYFDVLLASLPRLGGFKLSSGHLAHIGGIRARLEQRYQCPVRLYLISRDAGSIIARTVRSNSPTLVEKIWSAYESGKGERGLLLAHVQGMREYIHQAEGLSNVKRVRFEAFADDMAVSSGERYLVREDQKASGKVPVVRDLTGADQILERRIQAMTARLGNG